MHIKCVLSSKIGILRIGLWLLKLGKTDIDTINYGLTSQEITISFSNGVSYTWPIYTSKKQALELIRRFMNAKTGFSYAQGIILTFSNADLHVSLAFSATSSPPWTTKVIVRSTSGWTESGIMVNHSYRFTYGNAAALLWCLEQHARQKNCLHSYVRRIMENLTS